MSLADAGDLDPTFGENGIVRTDFGNAAHVSSLVLAPDGELLVAGTGRRPASGDPTPAWMFALAHYSPDPSFGTGGRVTTAFGGIVSGVDLALHDDGKLVTAGSVQDPRTSEYDVILASFSREACWFPDGSIIAAPKSPGALAKVPLFPGHSSRWRIASGDTRRGHVSVQPGVRRSRHETVRALL